MKRRRNWTGSSVHDTYDAFVGGGGTGSVSAGIFDGMTMMAQRSNSAPW